MARVPHTRERRKTGGGGVPAAPAGGAATNTEGAPPAPGVAADAPGAERAESTAGDEVVAAAPPQGVGEAGKGDGAAAGSAPEPGLPDDVVERASFVALSPILLDGEAIAPGQGVMLTRSQFDQLKAARAIAGDWPAT